MLVFRSAVMVTVLGGACLGLSVMTGGCLRETGQSWRSNIEPKSMSVDTGCRRHGSEPRKGRY